ncbi:NAD(P)-dependent oxidoreductase [Leucobacter sp. UCMA 4100]|uniref:NAD(P)-dependent oxidoreductase n=1 Tax=Leucobacter sp. UCMA 4100 TaxID=2810534 RepID=UPI0022EA83AD|nr:DUF1932 domain-containing protein [Leucobacter sp. UCMA 4100]MDA3146620.1 NAD(P)-dependent oxidoreductase [Leucobacter sp. UCMA 4100]
MTVVVVLGLGEAGAIYARGFRDSGFTVRGFDPFVVNDDEGITQCDDLGEALAGAQLVVSLVGARAAGNVAKDAMAHLERGTIFADLNTGSPDLKYELGLNAAERGVAFADVAVLAPVPRSGVQTPLMASGSGAQAFADLMVNAHAPVEAIDGDAGAAASRKLLRSVFMKGLAAVVIESITAAEAAGCDSWLRGQIADEFSGDAEALTQRLIDGSRLHAERRAHEVLDAQAYVRSLQKPTWVSEATHTWFEHLMANGGQNETGKGTSV